LNTISFTVYLGIYPSIVLDNLHYNVSTLIYAVDLSDESKFLEIPYCETYIRYDNEFNELYNQGYIFFSQYTTTRK
jgi:hypothetical protein